MSKIRVSFRKYESEFRFLPIVILLLVAFEIFRLINNIWLGILFWFFAYGFIQYLNDKIINSYLSKKMKVYIDFIK